MVVDHVHRRAADPAVGDKYKLRIFIFYSLVEKHVSFIVYFTRILVAYLDIAQRE
jgi:hypothetical protein